jgi:NADPH:quinone reductase-like Zn-dependent oxidoreductase
MNTRLNGDFVVCPTAVSDPDELPIRVVTAAANPKDCEASEQLGLTSKAVDDMARTVAVAGSDVFEFKPGDHVATLHCAFAPDRSVAEFFLASSYAILRFGLCFSKWQ